MLHTSFFYVSVIRQWREPLHLEIRSMRLFLFSRDAQQEETRHNTTRQTHNKRTEVEKKREKERKGEALKTVVENGLP